MGFPDMKYMDPDALGPPVIEKTFYKEYQENINNDVRIQREALSKPQQDMANNTFMKLF